MFVSGFPIAFLFGFFKRIAGAVRRIDSRSKGRGILSKLQYL